MNISDKTLEHLQNISDFPQFNNNTYECTEKLGTGGMGTVYLAEDKKLKRKVALKVLNVVDRGGALTERMLQEAYVIARLEHPGIVPIHDVGTLPDNRPFYTMKYVKGLRLDKKAEAAQSLTAVLRIFQKICEAVAFAHAAGIIHRDLKPENIMVGDFGEALVMDWGLAKVLNSDISEREITKPPHSEKVGEIDAPNLTEHGTIMGTPFYMAPEQERGAIDEIDQRTDVYALGAILSFILEKVVEQSPDEAKSVLPDFIKKRFKKYPKRLYAIALKAMSEAQDDRYKNALLMRDDIENYLGGLTVSAYKENFFEKISRVIKHNKFLILLILVYVFVRAVFIFLKN